MGEPSRNPAIPDWLGRLVAAAAVTRTDQLARYPLPPDGGRDSAVLVLFGEGPHGPDVLLIQRSHELTNHPGQPAFPGGGADAGDNGPVATALREATEEVGLDGAGVEVVAVLAPLHIPVSGFLVTPVVGWWRDPSPVRVVDPAEVARVERIPLDELVDPGCRSVMRHPSGYLSPAFEVRGMLVWGFTAGLLDRMLDLAGWSRPWDRGRVRELPARPMPSADRVPPSTHRPERGAGASD